MKVRIRIDDWVLAGLFVVSFFNRWLILLMLAYICYKAISHLEYAIEGLLLISFRTILGNSVAVDIAGIQIFKWMVIFILSILILMHCWGRIVYKFTDVYILMFTIYVCMVSLINSTYPIVSIFKCISYSFVFWAILRGIEATKNYINWLDKLYQYMTILFLACFISMPFSFAYYSSARWFAGVTNQSNMLGVLAGLYIGVLLTKMLINGPRLGNWFMFTITVIMVWMSNSRTGMLSIVISVLIFTLISTIKYKRYYYLVIIGISLLIIYLSGYGNVLIDGINVFLYKGSSLNHIGTYSTNDIFSSREGQLANFLAKIKNNPLIGSGFSVPFTEGIVNWSFKFDLIVEPGNIFYAVLGDLGIIGTLLWFGLYAGIFKKGFKVEMICLFTAPFTISLGEMVFFSTNNIAIILYVMIAIHYATIIDRNVENVV